MERSPPSDHSTQQILLRVNSTFEEGLAEFQVPDSVTYYDETSRHPRHEKAGKCGK